nr:hypothetical protein [Devosia soli]
MFAIEESTLERLDVLAHEVTCKLCDQRFDDDAVAPNIPTWFEPDLRMAQANASAGLDIRCVELARSDRKPMTELTGLSSVHLIRAREEPRDRWDRCKLLVEEGQGFGKMLGNQGFDRTKGISAFVIETDKVEPGCDIAVVSRMLHLLAPAR